jgi:hypothetical protein
VKCEVVEELSERNTLILKVISLRKAREASVKTITGLCAVISLLGSLLAEAQAQQNMGTREMGPVWVKQDPAFTLPAGGEGL